MRSELLGERCDRVDAGMPYQTGLTYSSQLLQEYWMVTGRKVVSCHRIKAQLCHLLTLESRVCCIMSASVVGKIVLGADGSVGRETHVTKPDYPSLISKTHVVERKNQLCQVDL